MNISVDKAPKDWVVVEIKERWDSFNYDDIKLKIDSIIGKGQKKIAFNFREADFLSINSIKYLSSLADQVNRQGGKLAMLAIPEKLKRQIDIYASLDSMQVYRDQKEWHQKL